MTRQAHDALFKAAFEHPEHSAALFDAAMPPRLRRTIAWSTLAPRSAEPVDERLGQHRNDLLFSVEFAEFDGSAMVLLEHQSSIDETMSLRVLHYLARIWSTRKPPLPPIFAVVLSHAPEGWTAPTSVRELVVPGTDLIPELEHWLPAFSIHVVDLIALSDDDLMAWQLPPFPKLALWLLRDARHGERLLANFSRWAPLLASVHTSTDHPQALTQLFRYIALVAGEEIFTKLNTLIRAHIPETEDTLMTIAEALHERGRQEGRQEGLHELVLRQLELRFGSLTTEHRELLRTATETELAQLGAGLLASPSAATLFASLRPRPSS